MYPFVFAGLLFFCVGMIILCNVLPIIKKMKQYNGLVVLSADDEGLSVLPGAHAPASSSAPFMYSWNTILRIVMAEKIVVRERHGKKIIKNGIVVFFRSNGPQRDFNFFEKQKRNFLLSPRGLYYLHAPFPPGKMDKVKRGIQRFAKNYIEIQTGDKLCFDYDEHTEQLIP